MKPTSEGVAIIVVDAVFAALASVAVILRFFARYKTKVKLGVDDYLAATSLLFIIGTGTSQILWVVIGGNGQHYDDLTSEQHKEFYQLFTSTQVIYNVAISLVKATVLTLYRQLFPLKWVRIVVDILLAVCLAWCITSVVTTLVECVPMNKDWEPTVSGHCINTTAFLVAVQAVNVALDVSIFILPWPMVFKLHRPWRDKLGLCAVFLLGIFCIAASCLRLWALTIISYSDESYTVEEGTIWSMIEICVGTICACGPIVWAILPKSKSSKRNTTHYKSSAWTTGGRTTQQSHATLPFSSDNHHAVGQEFTSAGHTAHRLEVDSDSTLGET